MDGFDVDLFVIGGGSGGVRAARVAASHGARVMLAEEARLGGTCVIRGCIPKKLLVYAGRYGDMLKEAEEFGWDVPTPRFDWRALVSAKDKEISRLESAYAQMQAAAGVEVLKSRAVVEDAHTVRLLSDDRRVKARVILIATGARPDVPPIDGISLGITSDDAFDLPELPRRVVIGGAGYIAVEFAGLFAALGSDVTIVCRGDNVLRGFDEDLREALAAAYQGRGIKLMFNDAINRIERTELEHGASPSAAPLLATTANGALLAADHVLLAFGRIPNTRGLGLEEAGVELDGAGAVVVNENARTRVPSIYAVGDATNRFNLTPVAIREGHAFADSVFGQSHWRVGYSLIPTAVFSTPEIGTVGLSEAEAREKFPLVEVYKTAFLALRAKITGSPDRTLVKLVVDGESQRIVGVHLFADDASEMIQLIAVALEAGATHEQFVSAMAVHPTIGEELVTLRTPAERYDRRAVQAA